MNFGVPIVHHFLLLAGLMFGGLAWSQTDLPSKPKPAFKNQSASVKQNQELTVSNPAAANAPISGKLDVLPPQAQDKRRGQNHDFWKSVFFEVKITDVLLVLFTGLLVLFTGLLWWVTAGLRDSTDKLWSAADKQGRDMEKSLEISALQTRVAVAAQIPVVAWVEHKLVWTSLFNEPSIDPVPPGIPPAGSRPVFVFRNVGPSTILTLYYAMKWEVRKELASEPFFGAMHPASIVLKAGETYAFTIDETVILTNEQRQNIQDKETYLWAYGFVIYNDFLDEAHQIGAAVRWDLTKGFVPDGPQAYNYSKSEKTYTRQT